MTPVDLEALAVLSNAATPGEWRAEGDFIGTERDFASDMEPEEWALAINLKDARYKLEDAVLIVALRNNATAMIEELRALRKEKIDLIKMNKHVNFNFDCIRGELLKREAIHNGLLATVETLGVERDALRAEVARLKALVKHQTLNIQHTDCGEPTCPWCDGPDETKTEGGSA